MRVLLGTLGSVILWLSLTLLIFDRWLRLRIPNNCRSVVCGRDQASNESGVDIVVAVGVSAGVRSVSSGSAAAGDGFASAEVSGVGIDDCFFPKSYSCFVFRVSNVGPKTWYTLQYNLWLLSLGNSWPFSREWMLNFHGEALIIHPPLSRHIQVMLRYVRRPMALRKLGLAAICKLAVRILRRGGPRRCGAQLLWWAVCNFSPHWALEIYIFIHPDTRHNL